MNLLECEHDDPSICPTHSLVLMLEKLEQEILRKPSKKLLEDFYLLRKTVELNIRMGGDEFINFSPNHIGHNPKMSLFIQNISTIIYPTLMKRTREYHLSEYTQPVIKGTDAERVFNKSLIDCGFKTRWDEGSHSPGPDIYLTEHKSEIFEDKDYLISVKSGEVDTLGQVEISGSRLGKHKTIEDKLAFLEITKPDMYFFFSHKKGFKKDKVDEIVTYQTMALEANSFSLGNAKDWEEQDNNWVFKSLNGPLLGAAIRKNMSNQIWLKFDTKSPDFKASIMPIRVRDSKEG